MLLILFTNIPFTYSKEFKLNKEYYEINNKEASTSDKIEILEFFWYGCIHCATLEKKIVPWKKTLSNNIVFIKVPLLNHDILDLHGQLFFTLESMGVPYNIHESIFNEINIHNNLFTLDNIVMFLESKNIDTKKFLNIFNSFPIKMQIATSKELAIKYKINSVPSLVLNGKYRFDSVSAGGHKKMIDIANYLIKKINNHNV